MGNYLIVCFSVAAIPLILFLSLSQERQLRQYKSKYRPALLTRAQNVNTTTSNDNTGVSSNSYENANENANKSDLESTLNFTRRDVLNFLHFSKTGGTSLSDYMVRALNHKLKDDGTHLNGLNLCAKGAKVSFPNSFGRVNFDIQKSKALKAVSRCTWDTLRKRVQSNISVDFIYGHQYRLNGAESILAKNTNVRTFTIMRHPLSRKISFFYHFLVRAASRTEESVAFEELRDFLIYDKIPKTQEAFVVRHDIGPNYMTGRLLSDGKKGFAHGDTDHHTYYDDYSGESAENAVDILDSFVFIGLQTQREANMCMLKNTIAFFKKAHRVKADTETEELEQDDKRLNSGGYSISYEKVLRLLTDEEIRTFETNEHSDLRVYEEGVRLFHEHANQFGCESHIRHPEK